MAYCRPARRQAAQWQIGQGAEKRAAGWVGSTVKEAESKVADQRGSTGLEAQSRASDWAGEGSQGGWGLICGTLVKRLAPNDSVGLDR